MTGARLAAGLLALAAATSVAVTVASGAIHHTAAYSCPPAGTPTIGGTSWTALSQSVSVTATVNPNGAPTVLSYATTGTLTTNLPGPENDLVFTGTAPGRGEPLGIIYTTPGTISQPLIVSMQPLDVKVQLQTDADGDVISTANDVMAAINADPVASLSVIVSLAPGNDGTGIVTSFSTKLVVLSGVSAGIAAGSAQTVT
ncbi:MAG: hypothetical protein QOE29_68, partial [Gaiellaceae bacterium]|nr:hypothetical protein [Gaiellaceae bacterium]